MRTIKFQVMKTDGEWAVYSLGDLACGDAVTHDELQFKPETWRQFTGLHDKNSKEIYEGDICKSDNTNVGRIRFHNGAFCWTNGAGFWWIHGTPEDGMPFDATIMQLSDVSVIGNIYENPELLNETH